jgi:hypothetical protein
MSKIEELKAELAALEEKKEQPQSGSDDPNLKPTMVDRDDPAWRSIRDDDPEMLELCRGYTPPEPGSEGEEQARFTLWFDEWCQRTCPHLLRPKTLEEAKRIVAKRRVHRALYATITDETKPRAERLQAIRTALETILEPGRHYLRQFSSELLLDRVIPAGATKLYGSEARPVPRPPQQLDEVWEF